MNIKGLIGYNVFETANNICGAIRLYNEGLREIQDLVNGVHQAYELTVNKIKIGEV